ncbi:MAG: DUF454 family protein [Deltaproteobacteria bacterium]|nr:DUF454 family protein [Deltaproteobacteria bacterium]
MRRKIKRWTIILLGWVFILIGVAGFFLPILPGFPFFIIGLGIVSSKSRWAKRMLERWKKKHPEEYTILSSWKERLKEALKRG